MTIACIKAGSLTGNYNLLYSFQDNPCCVEFCIRKCSEIILAISVEYSCNKAQSPFQSLNIFVILVLWQRLIAMDKFQKELD